LSPSISTKIIQDPVIRHWVFLSEDYIYAEIGVTDGNTVSVS